MVCFVGDEFVSNAKVPLLDLGVLRGFGVFEFTRTYHGRFFHLDTHIKRFFQSAKAIGLSVPYSQDEIERLCYELFKKNGLKDGNVKMILTGGSSQNGFDPGDRPLFALIASEPKAYCGPLTVATSIYERYLPECKTLNYLPAILERKKAQANGFDEVLFLDHHGFVLEGARENFFAIKNDVLITPKSGVLQGVTRAFVIEVAKDLMEVQERPLAYAELNECQEAFFTSTAREIAPIVKLDTLEFTHERTFEVQKSFALAVTDTLSLAAQS